MEEEFWAAAKSGNEEAVGRILRENPEVDVNWADEDGFSAFHMACVYDHDRIVAMLLARPDIDVNRRSRGGDTPFLRVCLTGRTSCARLLLRDPRVTSLNEPDNDGYTPLFCAASWGHLEVIEWWIASGRELDLGERGGGERANALEEARKEHEEEIVFLLEKFRDHPGETRREVRVELGWYDEEAAEVFALVVFLCDGLLRCKARAARPAAKRTRFLQVMRGLPMELQMILCYRVVGSAGVLIPAEAREAAFKSLVRRIFYGH